MGTPTSSMRTRSHGPVATPFHDACELSRDELALTLRRIRQSNRIKYSQFFLRKTYRLRSIGAAAGLTSRELTGTTLRGPACHLEPNRRCEGTDLLHRRPTPVLTRRLFLWPHQLSHNATRIVSQRTRQPHRASEEPSAKRCRPDPGPVHDSPSRRDGEGGLTGDRRTSSFKCEYVSL